MKICTEEGKDYANLNLKGQKTMKIWTKRGKKLYKFELKGAKKLYKFELKGAKTMKICTEKGKDYAYLI